MLILPDKSLLNDGLLDRADALQKFKERKNDELDAYRLPDQEELTNTVARVGLPMSTYDFVKKVTSLNKRLFTEDSWGYSNGVNFYTVIGEKKVCCNAPFIKGFLPEFDIVHVDERDLPIDKTPGWRGVLNRLIANGFLKKSKVDRLFGIPSLNEASSRWHRQTRKFN